MPEHPSPHVSGLIIEDAVRADVTAIAALHASAFPQGWPVSDWLDYLGEPSVMLLVARFAGEPAAGFVLARRVLDEAEILTIAIDPKRRRSGVALALMAHLQKCLGSEPPCRLFLEVSVENNAAISLYRKLGLRDVDRRKNYYLMPDGRRVDAIVLSWEDSAV